MLAYARLRACTTPVILIAAVSEENGCCQIQCINLP